MSDELDSLVLTGFGTVKMASYEYSLYCFLVNLSGQLEHVQITISVCMILLVLEFSELF